MRALLRAPPRPLTCPVRPPVLPAGIYLAAMTLVQMVRRPSGPPLWNSMFVEDGEVFLQSALTHSFTDSLTTPYQGYLHVVPRTIAEIAGALPLDQAPLTMSLLTTGTVAALSLYVYVASAAWIGSRLLRGVLAVAFVLLPSAAIDMQGVASYISWYFLYASFWALASPWTTRGWIAVSSAVVLLTALSNPLAALLLPIGLAMAFRVGRRRAWIVAGMAVAGLVAQVVAHESTQTFGETAPGAIPRLFADRVTSSLLVGERFLKDLFGGQSGSAFAWASLVVVGAACAAGLWRLRGRRAWLLGGCAGLGVTIFCVAALVRGTGQFLPEMPWLGFASRYVYPAVMFLLTGLLAAVDRAERSARLGTPREWVAALAVLAVIVVNLPLEHHSVRGPHWKSQLKAARERCERAPAGRPREVLIPTTPYVRPGTPRGGPFTWEVRLRCSRL